MPDLPKCSRCGAPLAADVPGSPCLRCLLEFGLKRDEPPDAAGNPPPPDETDEFPGYQILERIGEGGCGVVCRAAQLGPVQREVAIKVIKLGMDSRAVLTRFAAERQALALMDHPNIARVFDAGVTGRGRPFIVMELVSGERITDYCDRKQLAVPQRLELFLEVCEAVRHAHHKGVIHRDLKPSNILVTATDGRPVPKVIDFGVAKAMGHQRLADQTIYTAFDQFVGTPAYMSPEQAGLTGEDIDARSDIYSLGVLLYELLTGRPPFEPERLRRAALDEVCRIIREEEPTLPSARLTTLGEADLTATAQRRLRPGQRLVSELRGDLDGIVMKALEKNRDRRYDTANELAADIHRHLRHEPVSARMPGTLYRFRKFAQRHRLTLGAAAMVFCALLAGLTVSSWLFFKEKRARERLEQRAYFSDMNAAARMAALPVGGLGGAAKLLADWRTNPPDRRGWEWYYLNGLCHQDLLTIRADDKELWSVSWSPDGRRLATGGAEGTVKIWDAATGQRQAIWGGHSGAVLAVAWSPDGRWLASAGADKTVRIWAVETGAARVLGEHGAITGAVAWTPDGKWLASGSVDGTVKIWNPVTGENPRTFAAGNVVRAVCWNGDGTRLFACGACGLVKCWDTAIGREVWGFSLNSGSELMAAACSPDGRELATGGLENAVNFRDAGTGTNLVSLWDNQNAVLAIAWAADGTRLATATRGDGRVVIRDATAGGRVIRDFRGHLGSVRSVCWRPDGIRLASASADGTVKVWDAIRQNPSARMLRQPDQAKALAWSPDGTKLAAGSRRTDAWIWDLNHGGTPIALAGGYTAWTFGVAWNPDGARLASVGTDGLKVWDPATLAEVWQDRVSAKNLRAVAWRADGRQLAAVSSNQKLLLWDAASGKLIKSVGLPGGSTVSLAWSPAGGTLATGAGGDIYLWNEQLEQTRILSGHQEGVTRLAWSPDGTRLASAGGDTSAKIWDLRSGRVRHTLLGHGAPIHGVAWSPDGSRLVTGSWDLSLKLWDTETGVEVCTFDQPAGLVQMIDAVAWSPDGRRIAASDIEGCIGILDASPGWLAETGVKVEATASPADQAAAATIRSLQLYCDTVEPHANNDTDALRRVAWIRATARYPEVRDGRKAVLLAERANLLAGGLNAGVLNILAAAYAETGDFPKAVATQKQAISLLSGAESRAGYLATLKLYEAGRPRRDDAW